MLFFIACLRRPQCNTIFTLKIKIAGHRGLDPVIVTRNAGNRAFISTQWELIRSALVARDPVYSGDEVAFWEAYGSGDYAPNLILRQLNCKYARIFQR